MTVIEDQLLSGVDLQQRLFYLTLTEMKACFALSSYTRPQDNPKAENFFKNKRKIKSLHISSSCISLTNVRNFEYFLMEVIKSTVGDTTPIQTDTFFLTIR